MSTPSALLKVMIDAARITLMTGQVERVSSLAGRALEVCDSYSSIAPDVPHALHMPTHIYTRLGDDGYNPPVRSATAAANPTGPCALCWSP